MSHIIHKLLEVNQTQAIILSIVKHTIIFNHSKPTKMGIVNVMLEVCVASSFSDSVIKPVAHNLGLPTP